MARGLYLEGSGFFYRLSPPAKILGCVLLFGPPVVFNDPWFTGALCVFFLVGALASGAGRNIRRLRGLLFVLFLMSLILWPLFRREGEVLLALGPLPVTRGGLLFGLSAAFRLSAFLFVALTLLSTTTVEALARGLHRLGVPFRVAFALSLAFRLVPLFTEAGRTIVAAQKSRGLDLESGGLFARARKHVPVIVPILLTSIRRADGMAVALEARGFGAGGRRTSLSDVPVGRSEVAFLLIAAAILAGSILLRVRGLGALP